MSLTLRVDGDRWRTHLKEVAAATPGLTPVVKGNGYGFTLGRLARRSAWLGVDTLAVGTYAELPEVATRFPGDLLVLSPWRPGGPADPVDELEPDVAGRLVHTVSRLSDLTDLLDQRPDARLVLERATSMLRHGMSAAELRQAGDVLRERRRGADGVALHLPLAHGSHVTEVHRLLTDVVAADLGPGGRTVWVSHLTRAELDRLRAEYPDHTFRPRVGTDLWLGDRGALRVTATRARRAPGRPRRRVRLPRAQHAARRARAGGQRRDRARDRARGPARGRLAPGAGRDARPGRAGRGRAGAVAVLHRRQAAAVRRAARTCRRRCSSCRAARECRPSGTRSRCGCATRRRCSTAS